MASVEAFMGSSLDRVLEKLKENEIAVSRLYAQFSQSFAEDADFWNQLSQQERQHAGWIERLREMLDSQDLRAATTVVNPQVVDSAIAYADTVREKSWRGDLTRLSAYAIALEIENSLIEKSFFSLFVPASSPYEEILKQLLLDTEGHRQKIGEALEAIRSQEGNI
jgi:hypothetical protein